MPNSISENSSPTKSISDASYRQSDSNSSSPKKLSTVVDTVRVAVRVRPLNNREQAAIAESKLSWSINNSSITQQINGKPIPTNVYSFDNVFDKTSNNEQIFDTVAKSVVSSTTEGINGVIFAYGQTAAGKTYTMLGTEKDPGVTRRSISSVFKLISTYHSRRFLLRASYIEIYNEVIRDLLVPGNENLKIHEDVINKRVFVDCREEVVTSEDQVMDIIKAGELARAVGETNMNERSSRSHTIFSLKIESTDINQNEPESDNDSLIDGDDGVAVKSSTLSLVDLAGSERASFTKAQGMRLVEGGHINKSLLTLGTVINKLSSGETRSTSHIPYRDSKLTRLLQPALGGNARTAIICAITPAILHMEETLSTLKFATRAKKVTNKAQTNEFLDDRAKLRRAEKQISALRKELKQVKAARQRSSPPRAVTRNSLNGDANRRREQNFERKFDILLDALKSSNDQARNLLPSKSRRRTIHNVGQTSLAVALNLSISSKDDINPTRGDEQTEKMVSDLRKKVFQAEKDKRKAISDIEFERRAIREEIEDLEAAADESHKMRLRAEQESEDALNALVRAQSASLVDEMLSEAMATSDLKKELGYANEQLNEMENIRSTNEEMMTKVSSLDKLNSEYMKREKRGVGPYLKQVKSLQTKLTETEHKFKAARQNCSKMSSEKAVLEREIKDRDKKINVQETELEKHRNHTAKTKERISREVLEEKKKHEKDTKHLHDQICDLLSKTKDVEKQLEEEKTRILELESKEEEYQKQLNLTAESAKIKNNEITGLKQLVTCMQENEKGHLQQIRKLEEEEQTVREQYKGAETELRLAHVQLKKMRTEWSTVMESKRKQENEEINELRSQCEVLKEAYERLKGSVETLTEEKEESNDLLEMEREKYEKLLDEQADQNNAINKLNGKCTKLETSIVEHMEMEKSLTARLKQVEASNCLRCSSLRTELTLADDAAAKIKSSHDDNIRKEINNLQDDMKKLKEENDGLHGECSTRMKELHRISLHLKIRDERIYELEEELSKIYSGSGTVGKLEEKIQRRNIQIADLQRRIELQQEMLECQGLIEDYQSTQKIISLESTNCALREESKHKDSRIEELERERNEMRKETYKLRNRIKERDLLRINRAMKSREEEQIDSKRKRQTIQNTAIGMS